jgi:hypothetical protein
MNNAGRRREATPGASKKSAWNLNKVELRIYDDPFHRQISLNMVEGCRCRVAVAAPKHFNPN